MCRKDVSWWESLRFLSFLHIYDLLGYKKEIWAGCLLSWSTQSACQPFTAFHTPVDASERNWVLPSCVWHVDWSRSTRLSAMSSSKFTQAAFSLLTNGCKTCALCSLMWSNSDSCSLNIDSRLKRGQWTVKCLSGLWSMWSYLDARSRPLCHWCVSAEKCALSHFSLCFLVTCLLDFSTLPSLRAAASPLQRAGISHGRVMAASAPRGLMCDVLCPLHLLSVLLF